MFSEVFLKLVRVSLVVGLGAVTASLALANEGKELASFRIQSNRQKPLDPVCTLIRNSLNSLPAEQIAAQPYDLTVALSHNNLFTRPQWEPVVASSHFDVLGSIHALQEEYIGSYEFTKKVAPYINRGFQIYPDDAKNYQARMEKAYFDIDNDDEKDEVYRYFRVMPADQSDFYSGWSYFAPGKGYYVNLDLNSARGFLLPKASDRMSATYDAFFFDGKTYLLRGPFTKVIRVYLPEGSDSDGIGLSSIDKNARDSEVCQLLPAKH